MFCFIATPKRFKKAERKDDDKEKKTREGRMDGQGGGGTGCCGDSRAEQHYLCGASCE